jgi:IMP cyclohydrolase
MKEYMDFWFVDDESGEEFFVELACEKGTPRKEAIAMLMPQAMETAKDNFEDPRLIDVISEEEAVMLGFDTY